MTQENILKKRYDFVLLFDVKDGNPDSTIASAISLIWFSLMFSWKTFQLFHPMGGVSTKLSGWAKLIVKSENAATSVAFVIATFITTPC